MQDTVVAIGPPNPEVIQKNIDLKFGCPGQTYYTNKCFVFGILLTLLEENGKIKQPHL